jgi:WD40 repeat protein
LRAWIEAGAKGPDGVEPQFPEITTPDVPTAANARDFVTSLAISRDGQRLALGRYRHVDLIDPAATKQVLATTPEMPGKVNSVSFSADGKQFVAASGVPGLYGVATVCNVADGAIVSQVKGHRDALYDARLSPDGKLLATCSYDRQMILWDVATGKQVRTLSGHNGAVFKGRRKAACERECGRHGKDLERRERSAA